MGTIFIVFILTLGIVNGTLSTLFIIEKTSLQTRIAIGAVVGTAALSWIAFLAALALGLNLTSIGVTIAILAGALAIQIRFLRRAQHRSSVEAALRDFQFQRLGVVY